MKTISMMRRRPDLTLAQFETHYETIHVPAGYKTYYFLKYVRNYVQEVIAGAFEYDAVVEFYPDISHPAPTPSAETQKWFADDRAMFMDTKRAGGPVEETVLHGPARTADRDNMPKLALMASVDADVDAFGKRVVAAFEHDAEVARITVDRFRDTAPPQPCSAILWLWTARQASDVVHALGADSGLAAAVEARSYETPPDILASARG